MFGLFGGAKRPLKGYKITTVNRQQKYGIAADSLKMLKDKASVKFKVSLFKIHAECSFYVFILKFKQFFIQKI